MSDIDKEVLEDAKTANLIDDSGRPFLYSGTLKSIAEFAILLRQREASVVPDFNLLREVGFINEKFENWKAITPLAIDDPEYDCFAAGFKTAVGFIEGQLPAAQMQKRPRMKTLEFDETRWKLVPIKATSDQGNIGADELRQALTMLNSGRSYNYVAIRVYEAMIDKE